MKNIIIFLLLLVSLNSFAKIDEVSKVNLFNLPFNAQNIANIKVAGVVLVGTACLKGVMDLKRGTSHWHEINNSIRNQSAQNLPKKLAVIEDQKDKDDFMKKYQTNLNRLDRREKFDDMWFGFSRILMALAPFGFAYWFKS
jgi:hypothetical protein